MRHESHLEQKEGSNPWSIEELDKLRSLIGVKPLQQIKQEWNELAKKNLWGDRTDDALQVKLCHEARKLGKSRKATANNWSMTDLAKLLDIPVDRIRNWYRLGIDRKNYSFDGDRYHKTAISRKELKRFATAHPEEFWGIAQVKLSKIFNDSSLAKAIALSVEQPTVGRPITVIRLDTGDVYCSAKSAATALNLGASGKNNILKQLKRETPNRLGMEFARIDYPLYWVPLAVRAEFNMIAGKVFYEIYLQLRDLDGYSKLSCQIVAGRIAVQITLFTFRRNLKEQVKGVELSSKKVVANFWQTRILKNLTEFCTPEGVTRGLKRLGYGEMSVLR